MSKQRHAGVKRGACVYFWKTIPITFRHNYTRVLKYCQELLIIIFLMLLLARAPRDKQRQAFDFT